MGFQTYVYMGSLCETRNVWPLKGGLAHDPPIKFYENFVYCAFGGGDFYYLYKGICHPQKTENNCCSFGQMSPFFRVPGKT